MIRVWPVFSPGRSFSTWIGSLLPQLPKGLRAPTMEFSASAGDRTDSSPSAISGELVAKLRRRDPEALETFFDQQFPRVYSLVARLLRDRTEAEDITQETMLRVHRSLETLDPQRDPVPWVTAITYNVCRDYWRSRAYKKSRRTESLSADPDWAYQMADPAGGPEEEQEVVRNEAAVQNALARLAHDARALILMRDYQGMSHEQISRVLAIKVDAVRKRYSRALRDLGRLLEESRS